MEEEQDIEQEEVEDEIDFNTGEKKDDSHDSDDGDAGVGPSNRVPSPTAPGVSTQSNELPRGSSGTGTPNRTAKWAHELIFRNYNYKPWIGSCKIVDLHHRNNNNACIITY